VPNIGPAELAIVLIIGLIIFGPKRVPELGRSLGSGLRGFKDSVSGVSEAVTVPDEPPAVSAAKQPGDSVRSG
jgi:TatA/E family protein of Tat protein translocase